MVTSYDSGRKVKKHGGLAECRHRRIELRRVDRRGNPDRRGRWKRWVQVPCGQKTCPAVLCRQAWARHEAAIIGRSFKTLPPTHFVVLKAPFSSPADLWSRWVRFTRRLRHFAKRRGKLHYYMIVEQTPREPPHLHLLVRTDLDLRKADLRPLWRDACGTDEVTVYCRPVRSAANSARYLPKFWRERKEEGRTPRQCLPWLPGPEWAGVKLVATSRGFLDGSSQSIWDALRAEWFPDPTDWGSIPDWVPEPSINPDRDARVNADGSSPRTDERNYHVCHHNDTTNLPPDGTQSHPCPAPAYGQRRQWRGLTGVLSGRNPQDGTWSLRLDRVDEGAIEKLSPRDRERLYKPTCLEEWRVQVRPEEIKLCRSDCIIGKSVDRSGEGGSC